MTSTSEVQNSWLFKAGRLPRPDELGARCSAEHLRLYKAICTKNGLQASRGGKLDLFNGSGFLLELCHILPPTVSENIPLSIFTCAIGLCSWDADEFAEQKLDVENAFWLDIHHSRSFTWCGECLPVPTIAELHTLIKFFEKVLANEELNTQQTEKAWQWDIRQALADSRSTEDLIEGKPVFETELLELPHCCVSRTPSHVHMVDPKDRSKVVRKWLIVDGVETEGSAWDRVPRQLPLQHEYFEHLEETTVIDTSQPEMTRGLPSAWTFLNPVMVCASALMDLNLRMKAQPPFGLSAAEPPFPQDWLAGTGTKNGFPKVQTPDIDQRRRLMEYFLGLVCSDSPSWFRHALRPELPFAPPPLPPQFNHRARQWSTAPLDALCSQSLSPLSSSSSSSRWKAVYHNLMNDKTAVASEHVEVLKTSAERDLAETIQNIEIEMVHETAQIFLNLQEGLNPKILIDCGWSLVPKSWEFGKIMLPMYRDFAIQAGEPYVDLDGSADYHGADVRWNRWLYWHDEGGFDADEESEEEAKGCSSDGGERQ